MLPAKAQSYASDSYARWEGGQEEGLGPQRGSGVLFYDRTQLYKKQSHNRRTDNSNTQTSSDPWNEALAVKMVLTVQTAGSHETTHTPRDLIQWESHLIRQNTQLFFPLVNFVLNKRSVIVINDLQT